MEGRRSHGQNSGPTLFGKPGSGVTPGPFASRRTAGTLSPGRTIARNEWDREQIPISIRCYGQMSPIKLLVPAVAATLLSLTGCDVGIGDFERFSSDFHYKYPMN